MCAYIKSVLNGTVCAVSDANPSNIYKVARWHNLSAITYMALDESDAFNTLDELREKWSQEKDKAVRKNIMFSTARAQILSELEKNGIWYMPLKGTVLAGMYPKLGMRQMADNDILFDENKREDVKNIMESLGYSCETYGSSNHDVYQKAPIYNFEMHTSLYGEGHKTELQDYYKNVRSRLIKNDGCEFAYHFSNEDFYVYFVTHGFKHYDDGGTGLRFLVDLYVYLSKKQSDMDFNYVEKELCKLGISDFEKDCRALAHEIFGADKDFEFEKLSDEHKKMFSFFAESGTYGTLENKVESGLAKQGKFKYLILRLFPGHKVLQVYHPIFKHKWLMPIGWLYRVWVVMRSRPKKIKAEMKAVLRSDRKKNSEN